MKSPYSQNYFFAKLTIVSLAFVSVLIFENDVVAQRPSLSGLIQQIEMLEQDLASKNNDIQDLYSLINDLENQNSDLQSQLDQVQADLESSRIIKSFSNFNELIVNPTNGPLNSRIHTFAKQSSATRLKVTYYDNLNLVTNNSPDFLARIFLDGADTGIVSRFIARGASFEGAGPFVIQGVIENVTMGQHTLQVVLEGIFPGESGIYLGGVVVSPLMILPGMIAVEEFQ